MTRLAAFLFGLSLLSTPILVQAEGCTAVYRGATSSAVAQWDSFPCQPLPPDTASAQPNACYSYQPAMYYVPAYWYGLPVANPPAASSFSAPANAAAAKVMPASAKYSAAAGTATNVRGFRIRMVYR